MLRGEVLNAGDGVFRVFYPPVVIQCLAILSPITGRAGVVDLAVGMTTRRVVLGVEVRPGLTYEEGPPWIEIISGGMLPSGASKSSF